MSAAKGIEGPKAIYSWDNYQDAKNYGGSTGNIVEFFVDPKKLESDTYQFYDVLPKDIIAVHEPWHARLRYALENDLDPQILRNVGIPDYTRAAEELEKIRGIR
jgi:hypothetical protein